MTKRHPGLQRFIDDVLTPSPHTQAESEVLRICAFCEKPLTEFRNSISKQEYSISGLCQKCQDKTFGVD